MVLNKILVNCCPAEKIRHHSAATFPGYPFFGTGQHNSGSMPSQHSQHSSGQQYVATNECRLIEYRGARIAAFLSANRSQCSEYLLCLPQAFELFLKHLVGGLHTVYTKLKVSPQTITLSTKANHYLWAQTLTSFTSLTNTLFIHSIVTKLLTNYLITFTSILFVYILILSVPL